MRYSLRPLSSSTDLHRFKSEYEENVARRSSNQLRLSLPYDYLASSRTMGFFDRAGTLVAGYVLRSGPEFRCLRAIPPEVRASSQVLRDVSVHDLSELTCIWRNRGISQASFGAVGWPRIIFDCMVSGRKYILGLGFENKANDMYGVAAPELLYEGRSAAPETQANVYIYLYSRTRLAANFAVNFVSQMPGRIRSGRHETAAAR